MEKVYALIDGENIVNVVVGGTPEWFAEHEDYKNYTLIEVTEMEEKPSPSGWSYVNNEFVKDEMPEPVTPTVAEEVEAPTELVEPKPGLNPEV